MKILVSDSLSKQGVDSIVAQVIENTLAAEGGHRGRTAARLGISLRTIQRHVARGAGR